MQLKDIIRQGWESIIRNRLRSVLTALGIIWGLVSVVLLLAYGQGLGGNIMASFMTMGHDVIVLWPGQTSMQAGGQRAGHTVVFDYDDVLAVRNEVPIVRAVSAESSDQLPFKINTRVVSLTTRGVELPYCEIRRLEIADGRCFEGADFSERHRVVVLGSEAAKKVFQGAPAVGKQIALSGMTFEVIGVMKKKIQDSMYNGPDNEQAFIPYSAYGDIHQIKNPDMIIFAPTAPELNKEATMAVRAVLARRHHFDPMDEKAATAWDTIESSQTIRIFGLAITVVLGMIGALTLGVGGVGVMNIMLVSVTERTKEIGLRKALGARPRDILKQFLIEALVLTFAAGIIGMAVSVLVAYAIPPLPLYGDLNESLHHEGDIFLRPSMVVMLSSFFILAIVGITSGFWPALKASKMSPIDALRYD